MARSVIDVDLFYRDVVRAIEAAGYVRVSLSGTLWAKKGHSALKVGTSRGEVSVLERITDTVTGRVCRIASEAGLEQFRSEWLPEVAK